MTNINNNLHIIKVTVKSPISSRHFHGNRKRKKNHY